MRYILFFLFLLLFFIKKKQHIFVIAISFIIFAIKNIIKIMIKSKFDLVKKKEGWYYHSFFFFPNPVFEGFYDHRNTP